MRPRLKRTIEPLETPEGDLILMRSSTTDIRIDQPDGSERALLGALDGTHQMSELEDRFGNSEVRETIAQMQQLNLLEDGSDDDLVPAATHARFDRQMRYFSELASHEGVTPAECQLRLQDAKVAILGVGGLGGRVALELACVGVGELWLTDGDRVEVSNLNRQIQYGEADIERLKVEATATRLRAFNSEMRVKATAARLESQSELAEFIIGADIVVDAADWPAHEIERWCNSACFEVGIPYITMSHFPPIARVGPLYVPGETGCFACQEICYRREYLHYDVAVEQRRAKASPAATLGPACGLTGGLVATEVMHFLTGITSPRTLGAGYTMDLRSFELERYEVVPDPGCEVCGGVAATRRSTASQAMEGVER